MHTLPIKRQYQTTDQTSPWQGVVFTHEVDSDDLAEALKTSFPQYRTLRERKHASIIAFLALELYDMQSNKVEDTQLIPLLLDFLQGTSNYSGAQRDLQHRAQLPEPMSTIQSPTNSNTSSAAQELAKCPIQSAPKSPLPAIQGGQFIFNAHDGKAVRQRTKRKMTAEERNVYRETRRRGACIKCKRQKGKCTHGDNADSSPIDRSPIEDQSKREVSLDPNACNMELIEAPRLEIATEEGLRNNDDLQRPDPHQQQPPHTSHRSSNASNQYVSATDSPQWSGAVSEESQLSTPGYVQPSDSFQQTQRFFDDDQSPYYWPCTSRYDLGPTQSMGLEIVSSQCDTQLENGHYKTQVRGGVPSIRVDGPDQDLYLASGFPAFLDWDLGQEPYP